MPRRLARFAIGAALLICAGATAQAQVYEVTAGASSLYDARGGSLQLFGTNYQARFDVGYLDRPTLGVQFKTLYRGTLWGVGDESLAFALPTDLFNTSYLLTRGVSAERKTKGSRLYVFAGATSRRFALPFFSGAQAETPAALLFYERQLRPSLRLLSQNMMSARQTSIQTLQWVPASQVVVAAGGGIGNNGPYAASSLSLDRPWISLRTGYTLAGQTFGRIPVPGTSGAESERESLLLRLQRTQRMQFTVSRQNLLTQLPQVRGLPSVSAQARVNGLSGSATGPAGLQFHASFFDSASGNARGLMQHGRGTSVGASGELGRHLTLQMDLFENHSGRQSSRFGVATLRERLGGRLSLSQTVTRTQSGTTVSYGGQFTSNLISLGAESQIVYVPFAIAGRAGFQQALQLSVRVRLPHDASANVSTYLDALGTTKYTAYATAYAYGTALDPAGHPRPASAQVRLAKYIVTGRVVDPDGNGIAGAAIQVGKETVFSDSGGSFTSPQRTQQSYPLSVLLDQFMFDGQYEIVRMPATAAADVEASVQPVTIVLRRVR